MGTQKNRVGSFEHPKHMLKMMGMKNNYNFTLKTFAYLDLWVEQDVGTFWLIFLQRLKQATSLESNKLRHIWHTIRMSCEEVLWSK